MQSSDPCAGRSRRRRLSTLGGAVALVAVGSSVAAAQASAAAIAVAEPCVVNLVGSGGSLMVVGGMGFTPGDSIDVQSTAGGAFGTGTVDASGNLLLTMNAPILPSSGPAIRTFTLTASDVINPLSVPPTATFLVANLAVATNPAEAKPTKRVTWTFSGFLPDKTLYAHYVHGRKVATTRSFGRSAGPCGTLKTRAVFYPGKPKFATYTVQVDNSRRYSRKTLPRWIGKLNTHIPL